jgi:hypothetical protein
VTLAVPESLQPLFASKVVEATTLPLPEDDVEEVDLFCHRLGGTKDGRNEKDRKDERARGGHTSNTRPPSPMRCEMGRRMVLL